MPQNTEEAQAGRDEWNRRELREVKDHWEEIVHREREGRSGKGKKWGREGRGGEQNEGREREWGWRGILLKNSNYDITFVDLNKDIIDDIKLNGKFSVIYLDEDNSSDLVDNVKGLHGIDDLGQVIEAIGSTDLITTSLGQDNLKYITANIVAGIRARIEAGISKNLDIIACENGLQVSSFFKQLVYAELTEEEQTYCDEHIGFVDCTVDRIVPNQTNENICDVRVTITINWHCRSQSKNSFR